MVKKKKTITFFFKKILLHLVGYKWICQLYPIELRCNVCCERV